MTARNPITPLPFRLLCAGLIVAAATVPGLAAAARETAPARDSAPVLLSRTGGGGELWSNVKELQAAAAKGNPRAEAALGEILLRGDGLPRDDTRAVALLEKAARAGHSGAAFRLGMLLTHGENGVARDPVRAMSYFKAAAAGGEAEAFFNLGVSHANGRGVKRNYAEALGWLIVARQRGADPGQEQALRAHLKSYPPWITTGERRAKEIEAEFTDRKVTEFLPPVAPLDQVYDSLKPPLPGAKRP